MPKFLLKLQNIIFRFMPEKSFVGTGLRKTDFIELISSMMNFTLSEGLKNISCPVQVLCGERDNTNKKAAKKLAENIIGAKIQFVKDANHEVNIDTPKELAKMLMNFTIDNNHKFQFVTTNNYLKTKNVNYKRT